MIFQATIAIGMCVIALALTIMLQRKSGVTLGLPLAYIINLMLIHVPGAYAFVSSGGEFSGYFHARESVVKGIYLTAIGSMCFVVGLSLVTRKSNMSIGRAVLLLQRLDPAFVFFCLVTGWVLAFGVGALRTVQSLGAALYFGSSIWMLVASVRLTGAIQAVNPKDIFVWLGAILVYPMLMLVFGGFMSYGAAAVIVAGSLAVLNTRSTWQSILLIFAIGFLGLSVFVNYFQSRNELRAVVWSNAGFEQRLDATVHAFADFRLFSPSRPEHMNALAVRLNQNEFVGIAADRLERGQVDYLHGSTFLDALVAPIPRFIWRSKEVGGGSGTLVRDMTGLKLVTTTSWGVGNVLEFYMNFGFWSLVPGFILLGMGIGWLDQRAAFHLFAPDPSRSLLYFLPCVAIIQPNGSLVEIVGGSVAALVAAIAIRMGWKVFKEQTTPQARIARVQARRGS